VGGGTELAGAEVAGAEVAGAEVAGAEVGDGTVVNGAGECGVDSMSSSIVTAANAASARSYERLR
jgi:hypothetical protein